MVSHNEIYPVIHAIWNISLLRVHALVNSGYLPQPKMNVKEKMGVIDILDDTRILINPLSENYGEVADIISEIQQWIKTLDKEYGNTEAFLSTKHLTLTRKHSELLERDLFKWFKKIFSIYKKSNTELLKEKEFIKTAEDLTKKLEGKEIRDLHDGCKCILNNIPTPGAMILYRVGESMVRKFYKIEMTKDPPEGSTMGTMANEIRQKQENDIKSGIRKKPDSLLNYIFSQIEERNLAQHPEKRFTQIEAEEVFIFVKKLIEDIHEKL